MKPKCCREQLSLVSPDFRLLWVAGCRHLPPGRCLVGIWTQGCWGAWSCRQPMAGSCWAVWWGHSHSQRLPRRMTPWGEDAAALHPSEWSEKAGEGLHGLQARGIGTANPNPSLPPFPNTKFSQNIPKAALGQAKRKKDGL